MRVTIAQIALPVGCSRLSRKRCAFGYLLSSTEFEGVATFHGDDPHGVTLESITHGVENEWRPLLKRCTHEFSCHCRAIPDVVQLGTPATAMCKESSHFAPAHTCPLSRLRLRIP